MIGCGKVKRWTVDYLEGVLPKKKKVLFKEHLVKCSPCAREVETLVKTQRLVSLKAKEEMPEEFWAHYLPRLKRSLQEKPLPRLKWRPAPALAFATITALALLVVVATSLFRTPGLNLEGLPREVLIKEVMAYNSELDYFIADSFDPEEIVQALMPEEMLDSLIRGGESE